MEMDTQELLTIRDQILRTQQVVSTKPPLITEVTKSGKTRREKNQINDSGDG